MAVILLIVVSLALLVTPDRSLSYLKDKYAGPPSQFIMVDSLEVHFRDEGEGFPIVLLHGTAASLHTWDEWTDTLKQYYRVIRMDLPAFGLTGPSNNRDYSIASYTDFLNSFLSELNVAEFYLAGNSLGGRIAWNYTLKYPEQVKKLVLIDASGFPMNGEPAFVFELAKTPIINQGFKYITPKSFIEKNLNEVYYADSLVTDKIVTRYHDMSLRPGNRQAFIDRAQTKFNDNVKRLSEISAPTLILWGEHDQWIPLEHAHKFDSAIANSELIVFDNAGHIPMEEQPKLTAEPVLRFLKNESTPTSPEPNSSLAPR